MKILWLSENPAEGKMPRNMDQMRTDFAWFVASDGYHSHIGNLPKIPNNSYDIVIIILPKNEQILLQISTYQGFDLIGQMRRVAKKIGWMQEGPVDYFQDYQVMIQTWWFSVLNEMDFLMVHNESDKKYINGMFWNPVFVNRSLMIEDAIDKENLKFDDKKDIIVGGNFCKWYGGFTSYLISTLFEKSIYIPSMGRKPKDEEGMGGLNHLPYMSWKEWITRLSGFKYAVHLMPTHAAGTFALNCSYLKIPCIGYKELDTQRILHPNLSVGINDVASAKELALKLKNDEKFYQQCSEETHQLYQENYTEDIWKKNFFTFMELIYNK